MKYDIKPIITYYSGVKFRSRLEASWAAFFDEFYIKWEYEPFELGGWFPDFRISNPKYGDGELLVEVKPFDFKNKDELLFLHKRIRKACSCEVLLLGNSPEVCNDTSWGQIGLLLSSGNSEDVMNWWGDEYMQDEAVLNYNGTHADISAQQGSYAFRFSKEHDGDHHLRPVHGDTIMKAWKTARNETQIKF